MPNEHSKLAREAITPSKQVNEQINGCEESVGRAHVEHVGKAGETGPRGAGNATGTKQALSIHLFQLFAMRL